MSPLLADGCSIMAFQEPPEREGVFFTLGRSWLPPGKARLRGRLSSLRRMAKKRNWLQEERRKTLGDWVAFCVGCGFTQRYFEELAGALPDRCPQCRGELRSRCPACGARFSSAFAVECEACGGELRPPEQFGVRIRRKP